MLYYQDKFNSNNEKEITIRVEDNDESDDADLDIYSLEYDPEDNLDEGDEIDVTFKVRNEGEKTSRGFDYKVYLDGDVEYDNYSSTNLDENEYIQIKVNNLELPDTNDDEIEHVSSILKVDEVDVSTVNRGIPYLSSGAIVNDRSGIFGVDCTGPEMMRITSVLHL